MSAAGYKIYIELGSTSPTDGQFASYNKVIELDQCSYSFIRKTDARGKISGELVGGNISFIYTGVPDLVLIDWAITDNRCFSGYIHIKDSADQPKNRVFFENAVCVHQRMTYMEDGSGYLSVECTLQAETIQLDNSKSKMNNWTHISHLTPSSTFIGDVKDAIKSAINSGVSISVALTLGGVKYQIRSLELEFIQGVDHKGEPQTGVRGGVITVGLYDLPDNKLNEWMSHRQEMDGRITFGDDVRGYELTMDIKKCSCAGYFAEINTWNNDAVQARLSIVPKEIVFPKSLTYKVPY